MTRGDGFLVLNGGTGTLVELIVFWELAGKHLHDKPAAILGDQMRQAVQALSANPEVQIPKSLELVQTPKAAVSYFQKVWFDA